MSESTFRPRPRLLLVDDNYDNLEILTVILSGKYSVTSCTSAAEALRVLEDVRPDLLVLDIRMAPVDGVQCLEAIRAVRGYARTPAIALTAFARPVEREAFLAAGFQGVVTKPILDHRALERLIDTLVESGRSVGSSIEALSMRASHVNGVSHPAVAGGSS